MSKVRWQIVRDTKNSWMIWHLDDAISVNGEVGVEHEQIARVVFVDGAYYVELPVWDADGIAKWDRQPRPWTLKAGAVHSVTHPRKAMAS